MSAQQQTERAVGDGTSPGGGESTATVLVALGANLLVAVAKGVAAVITGSASMAAETAHSFADTYYDTNPVADAHRDGFTDAFTYSEGWSAHRSFPMQEQRLVTVQHAEEVHESGRLHQLRQASRGQ